MVILYRSSITYIIKYLPTTKSQNFVKKGTLDIRQTKPTVDRLGMEETRIFSCTYERNEPNDTNEHKIKQFNVRVKIHHPHSMPSFSRVYVAVIIPKKYSDEFHKFAGNQRAMKSFSTYDFHKTIKQFGDKASYDLNDDYFYMDFSYAFDNKYLRLHLPPLIRSLSSLDSNSLQEIEEDILNELSYLVPGIKVQMNEEDWVSFNNLSI